MAAHSTAISLAEFLCLAQRQSGHRVGALEIKSLGLGENEVSSNICDKRMNPSLTEKFNTIELS